jgi:hypothetical protein
MGTKDPDLPEPVAAAREGEALIGRYTKSASSWSTVRDTTPTQSFPR